MPLDSEVRTDTCPQAAIEAPAEPTPAAPPAHLLALTGLTVALVLVALVISLAGGGPGALRVALVAALAVSGLTAYAALRWYRTAARERAAAAAAFDEVVARDENQPFGEPTELPLLDTIDTPVVTFFADRFHANRAGHRLLERLGLTDLDDWPVYQFENDVVVDEKVFGDLLLGRTEALMVWIGHPGNRRAALLLTCTEAPLSDYGEQAWVLTALDVTGQIELSNHWTTKVSSLAHEIRNPLTSVLGHVDLVGEDPTLDERHRSYLETAATGTRRAINLFEELLARDPRDPGDRTSGTTDLTATVAAAVEEFRGRSERRGLRLAVQVAPALTVAGAPFRLRQVVDNLLSNAVKYNHDGGLLDVRLRHDGDAVELTVTNTGQVLTPGETEKIFELGFRSAAALASTEDGDGIGLGIAREIVAQHGGTITASTDPEAGTTSLRVRLPAAAAEPS